MNQPVRKPEPDLVQPPYRPALYWFSMFTLACTFVLLVVGGTVTSRGVGMAVPDWPTVYGYNMYLFPIEMWRGGIWWEHVHRLSGAFVGKLVIVLTIWLLLTQKHRRWMQYLGIATLLVVIIQGVMGGMRVREIDYRWGIVHGIVGQVFMCMLVVITAATSRRWLAHRSRRGVVADRPLRKLAAAMLVVLLIQLSLGSAMRHSESGLAIPDFPTSYGRLVPPMNQDALDAALDAIPYDEVTGDYQVWQVHIHFAHRLWAIAVVVATCLLLARLAKVLDSAPVLRGPALALACTMVLQIVLGASVIWSVRHPEIATAHQALGAVILGIATLIAARVKRFEPTVNAIPDSVTTGVRLNGAHG